MTYYESLIAFARAAVEANQGAKSLPNELGQNTQLITILAEALEAASSGMSTEWATAFVDENGKIGDPEYYYTHRSDAEDEARGSDAEGARILTRQVTLWTPAIPRQDGEK